jgi:hypothetical protein
MELRKKQPIFLHAVLPDWLSVTETQNLLGGTSGIFVYNSGNFVGVFAKLLKATISFVMSICLSVHMDQLGYNSTDLYEFLNWSIFPKFVQ